MVTMKSKIMLFAGVFFLFNTASAVVALAENAAPADNTALKQEVIDLKNRIGGIEEKLVQSNKNNEELIPSSLSGIGISGGISGGSFYAKNPEPDTSDNEFLLSNFLVELSPHARTLRWDLPLHSARHPPHPFWTSRRPIPISTLNMDT